MAKYRLEALLAARKVKEDGAARAARAAAFAVALAKEKAEAAKEELRKYRQWRPGEEKRLFEEIRGRVLAQTQLDGHRGRMDRLRDKEAELGEAVEAAEQAVEAAETAEREAKRLHIQAVRDREKIDEHRKRWLRGELKRQEAAEEAELEDFPARSPSGEEDGAEYAQQEDFP